FSSHAAGWAHGRVAFAATRFPNRLASRVLVCKARSAPSSPARLPSALKSLTLRLFATPGFPPTRTGLRAALRPSARPRSGPSGLLTTAPRLNPVHGVKDVFPLDADVQTPVLPGS